MTRKTAVRFACIALFSLGCIAGCAQLSSEAVKPPHVNPQAAAKKAMELYDANKDGLLDKDELEKCPGILVSLSMYDTDGDKKVSVDELATRLESLYSAGVGLMPIRCRITKQRRPLSGATVRFIPEPFLGDAILAAEGYTNNEGEADMAIPDEKLPKNQQGLYMMQVGIYRVEITHPKLDASKDAKPLGCEVDPNEREIRDLLFKL